MEAVRSIAEGNATLKSAILSGKPFIASKMGAVEQAVIATNKNGKFNQWTQETAPINAGITPANDETLKFFYTKYTDGLLHTDYLGVINNDIDYPYEKGLVERYCRNAKLFGNRFLEPFYFEHKWSDALAGKSVLVIHPFSWSIRNQYNKHFLSLPEFDLITLKAAQTNGGGLSNSKPFIDSFLEMQYDVLDADFDIALIGCGAYGLLLADTIKSLGKQAIHIGGGLQIMFGIKGKRWDEHPEISKLYTDDWARPLESERTLDYKSVENGCYW